MLGNESEGVGGSEAGLPDMLLQRQEEKESGKMSYKSIKGKAFLHTRAASPMTRFQREEAPGSG